MKFTAYLLQDTSLSDKSFRTIIDSHSKFFEFTEKIESFSSGRRIESRIKDSLLIY
jgi:hypothetical protein